MALTPEDGTGLANADTYASEAELATYAAARGVTVAGTDTQLLIAAMDYLESKDFIGTKYSSTQALQWPRNNVMIDGYSVPYSTIPQLLKDAQIEIALSIDGGTNPLTNIDRETKREKVGDIEVEYATGASNRTYLTAAETKLAKLVKSIKGSYRV
jgi:hypothetical protein